MTKKESFYNSELNFAKSVSQKPYYANTLNFKNKSQIKINHVLSQKSSYLNAAHINPYSGLLNDPNGMFYYDGFYYIFYQNSPAVSAHKNKHWSAYKTSDFVKYEDLGIIIEPSEEFDLNGIYSGGAFVHNDEVYLYYTGNRKLPSKEKEGEFDRLSTVVVTKFDTKTNKIVNKKSLFSFPANEFTGHVRDPFIFVENDVIYLLQGAQLANGLKGTVNVFSSKSPDSDFKYLGYLKIKGFDLSDAFMLECPMLLKQGDKYLLSVSTQGKMYFNDKAEKADTNIFLIGKINWETLTFEVESWSFADWGNDFYASQNFNNIEENVIIGWAAKPIDIDVATFRNGFMHSLTAPRKIYFENGKIYQSFYKIDDLVFDRWNENSDFELAKPIYLKADVNNDFEIKIYNHEGDELLIQYQNEALSLDRSNMSVLQSNTESSVLERKVKIKDIEIIIDNSLIEILANNGSFASTNKYFITGKKHIKLNNLNAKYKLMKEHKVMKRKEKVILLPGEALIDQFVSDQGVTKKVGGAPLNVVGAINLLNQSAYFLGSIGKDSNGSLIKNYFENNNMSTQYLSELDKKTTVANVSLDASGERSFTFERGADADYLLNQDIDFDALVLSSATAMLGDNLLETYNKLLAKANQESKLVFFDPNYREALYGDRIEKFVSDTLDFIAKSDVIKLSDQEYEMIFDQKLDLENLENSKLRLFTNKMFLITLGEKGVLVSYNHQQLVVPSVKTNVVDTTGAGDSFFGYFIAQFVEEDLKMDELNLQHLKAMLFKANLCASFVISKKGAVESLPSVQEIEDKFNEQFFNL
ncbi:PfkB family carbohydrate kinase [Mycoplasma sp. Ms02]|uniref:PfkB family carbohydrate kinase n=1 Tax=Mycoplasma sp. Ms02 TaxID=353851 RepID=UPI001C8A3EFC|nr:PfkB family carbohydrate kinase [Mycoplasma sp. Ms02]QZE12395.1 GH32 C-terminal domain-containing protein [Mycoplasma sp. Ms02]